MGQQAMSAPFTDPSVPLGVELTFRGKTLDPIPMQWGEDAFMRGPSWHDAWMPPDFGDALADLGIPAGGGPVPNTDWVIECVQLGTLEADETEGTLVPSGVYAPWDNNTGDLEEEDVPAAHHLTWRVVELGAPPPEPPDRKSAIAP